MTTETATKRQSVKNALKDVWEWLKSFPRPLPRRKVVIVGDVIHHGEPLQVPPGCCLEIRGNVIGARREDSAGRPGNGLAGDTRNDVT